MEFKLNNLFFYNELNKEDSKIDKESFESFFYEEGNRSFNFFLKMNTKINNYPVNLNIEIVERQNDSALYIRMSSEGTEKERLSLQETELITLEIFPLLKEILGEKLAKSLFSIECFYPLLDIRRYSACIYMPPNKHFFKDAWFTDLVKNGLKFKNLDRTFEILTQENVMRHYEALFFDLIELSTEKNEDWLDMIELEFGI